MTKFKFERHSDPPFDVYWAEGPCCGCGVEVEGEWESKKDSEDDWWCTGCWRTEELRRIKAQVLELEERVSHAELTRDKAALNAGKRIAGLIALIKEMEAAFLATGIASMVDYARERVREVMTDDDG